MWDDKLIPEALVGPLDVIVLHVLLDQMIQMLVAEADEVIQALVLDRAYPPLSVGVHDGCPPRDSLGLASGSPEHIVKLRPKLLAPSRIKIDSAGNPCSSASCRKTLTWWATHSWWGWMVEVLAMTRLVLM